MNYKAKVVGDVFRSGKRYAAGLVGVAVFLGLADVAWKKLNRRDAERRFRVFKQQQDMLRTKETDVDKSE